MRSLILAVVLGAALRAQAPPALRAQAPPALRAQAPPASPAPVSPPPVSPPPVSPAPVSPPPASPEPAASPDAPKPGTGFLTRQPWWNFFPDLKSFKATPAVESSRERISLKPGQACAIPLLNVLRRDNVDPKMILPAGPPAYSRMDARIRIVAPPAPSCDDVKR